MNGVPLDPEASSLTIELCRFHSAFFKGTLTHDSLNLISENVKYFYGAIPNDVMQLWSFIAVRQRDKGKLVKCLKKGRGSRIINICVTSFMLQYHHS